MILFTSDLFQPFPLLSVYKVKTEYMKKAFIFSKFLITLILIQLTGCMAEKYETTLPTDFQMYFTISEVPVMDGKLTIKSIVLNLNSIEIEGRRAAGEDVFMTRKFDDPRFIIIRPHVTSEVIDFNIPQGIYDRLSFQLNFRPDQEEENFYDDFEEWLEDMDEGEIEIDDLREDLGDIIEDYLEDVTPCLVMHAEYYKNNELYNVFFVINDPLSLNLLATNAFGERDVILDRKIINRGEIIFDPSIWFSIVQPPVLESSFHGVIDEDKYIFLHKKVNPLLFTTIYNRLDGSVILVINE
jgi:hypothetical protein